MPSSSTDCGRKLSRQVPSEKTTSIVLCEFCSCGCCYWPTSTPAESLIISSLTGFLLPEMWLLRGPRGGLEKKFSRLAIARHIMRPPRKLCNNSTTGRRLSIMLCIVAKQCALDKSYYWQPIGSRIWEIDLYQNEWPWPFRGRLRSCQPLRHIRYWICRKTLEIEAWYQKFNSSSSNRKLPMGNQMVTRPMTSSDPERSNSWPQYA